MDKERANRVIEIPEPTHRCLKILAAQQGTTMKKLVERLVTIEMSREGAKRLADLARKQQELS